jgi:hypothetical protein
MLAALRSRLIGSRLEPAPIAKSNLHHSLPKPLIAFEMLDIGTQVSLGDWHFCLAERTGPGWLELDGLRVAVQEFLKRDGSLCPFRNDSDLKFVQIW